MSPRKEPGWYETNQAWWDERAGMHAASTFYDLDGFVEDPDRLRPYEIEDLGDVAGRTLLHLQCHIGTDTLSWATRGARVTGLDFSEPAIEAARRTAARLGYDAETAEGPRAEFVVANVYDAAEALGHRQFDIVYTGFGALNWLDDLDRWAGVATSLVRPGGHLYVAEFHPLAGIFGDDDLDIAYGYWDRGRYPADGTYVDRDAELENNETVECNATIGEVVTAIASRGFVVKSLREHDWTLYRRWPWLVRKRGSHDRYEMPRGRHPLPLVWTLLSQRPHEAADG